jgi:hypothetical protein
MSLENITIEHNEWIDNLVAKFEQQLSDIVAKATARLQERLHGQLKLGKNGTVLRTPANMRVIKKLDQWYMEALDAEGYLQLLASFIQQFPGQMKFFTEVLDDLGSSLKQPIPKINFTLVDLRSFSDYAAGASHSLETLMSNAAAVVKNRVLLSFAGMKYTDLVTAIASGLTKSVSQAASLADTATATYYRILSNEGFQKLEKLYPGALRYRYYGPPATDPLIRPFCKKLEQQAATGKTWTRPEIDAMDNKSTLGDVFTSGGGWRCRHQWIVVLQDAGKAAA